MDKGAKIRCNSQMLPKLKGKRVCLLGRVTNIDKSQRACYIVSSDEKSVKVIMKDQILNYPKNICEIYGMVDVNCNIICDSFTCLDDVEDGHEAFGIKQFLYYYNLNTYIKYLVKR
ncbi:unnamed protein product [Gordionus sp. m RMFG-2023]